jgi:D-alanyl-D-alanine dipeptidase
MTVTEKEANNNKKLAWASPEDAKETKNHRDLPDTDDVDGFENAYDIANSKYSNGTALTVTVNAENKNSKNQTFDFMGTGVDIISRCDDTTGIMLISVKQEYEVDGKTKIKSGKMYLHD